MASYQAWNPPLQPVSPQCSHILDDFKFGNSPPEQPSSARILSLHHDKFGKRASVGLGVFQPKRSQKETLLVPRAAIGDGSARRSEHQRTLSTPHQHWNRKSFSGNFFPAIGFAALRPPFRPLVNGRRCCIRHISSTITHPLISDNTTPTQVRHMSLRVHRAARHACLRHACLRHACLRLACLRDVLPCHHRLVVSARVKRAGPASATPPPPSLLACAIRCDSSTPQLLNPATLCDSAPTPSVLRQ